MKIFEAIMEANHRALAGDKEAGIHPADFADELPIAALTCIDARLNSFFPDVLGLPKEQFIWLRNAGNIITGPMSSTMRSLALACAIKGAREIAIIGHTDCLVCKTSTSKLTEAFRALGVERGGLPDNLTDFFGLFASERQNVGKAVDFVRQSPLIGPAVPVHGLLVDINNGRLEWVVNGYQALEMAAMPKPVEIGHAAGAEGSHDLLKQFAPFQMGDMKFPDSKIGDAHTGPIAMPAMPAMTSVPVAPAPNIPAAVPATPPLSKPPPQKYPPPIAPRIPLPPRIRGR